jgi:hypothetical protein
MKTTKVNTMTKQELIKAADKMTGGNIQDLTVKQLKG